MRAPRRRAAALLLLALVLAPSASAGLLPAGLRPLAPAEADAFIVAGTFRIHDSTMRLSGDFVVLPGARLTLENVTLTFLASPDRHPAFRVLPGASVIAEGVTLTNAGAADEPPATRGLSWYSVDVRGTLRMRDSVVEYARAVAFDGPASLDNLVESSVVRHAAAGAFLFARGATGTLRGNHVYGNLDLVGGFTGGGVMVAETSGAVIEGNLFEDALGQSVIAVQASVTGALVWPTAAVVRGNLVYDSSPARDPARVGGFAVYADGATSATLIEGNAVAASYVGVGVAFGAGARVVGNDVLSVAVPGGILDDGLAGLRANGTRVEGRRAEDPTFEGNRVRGFAVAAQATGEGAPAFSGNALGPSNALGLHVDSALAPVDSRGNWWGPRGPAGRVDGPADVAESLAADPWAARAFDVALDLEDPLTLCVALTNRLDVPVHAVVHLRNAPGAPASLAVDVPPGGAVLRVPLSAPVPAGTDAVALALTSGGATAAAAAARGE